MGRIGARARADYFRMETQRANAFRDVSGRGAEVTPQRWRVAMVSLCVVAALLLIVEILGGIFGIGFPRLGLWGMQQVPDKPFTLVITSLDPGGAADRAGIRSGDVI